MVCTAAPWIEGAFPEPPESPYAAEGTEAHKLLEAAIKAKARPSELEPDHPAAKDVDQAYDLISPALDNPNYVVLSETRVDLHPSCWGTADAIILGRGTLTIIDYKHGRGVLVEVPSVQLEIYAAAALKSLAWMAEEPITSVNTVIVQPRAEHPDGPVRSAKYSVDEMVARGVQVRAVADLIEANNGRDTVAVPTEKGCRWCRAAGKCIPQCNAVLAAAKAHFTACDPGAASLPEVTVPIFDVAGNEMTLADKLAVFEAAGAIKDFLNAVEADLLARMLAGEKVTGKKLVAGRSNRKWAKEEAEIIKALMEEVKLKKSDIMVEKLAGIPAIEKLVDPEARNGKKKVEILKSLITKPEGNPTIVNESDKRPALTGHFTKVEGSADPLA
jgi:hypothetical protein